MNRFIALLLLAGVVAANSTSALPGRQGLVDSLFDPGVGPNRLVLELAIQVAATDDASCAGGYWLWTPVSGLSHCRPATLRKSASAVGKQALAPIASAAI